MKKLIKSIFALALILMMMPSCNKKSGQSVSDILDKEEDPIVEVVTISEEAVADTSEYSATVQPFASNNISSNSGCRIKRLLVDVGSHVSAGQRVVILDDVNVDQQQISLNNQLRDLNRAKELVRIGGGTQQTVDQLQAQYDANCRAMQNMKENTVLTSPISGVVVTKNFQAGDLPSGPILVVEQQNPLKVVVAVNETELPYVRQGMPVNVRFDTYPGQKFSGHVYIIHPTVDASTRTFQVEITIDNNGNKVHTGMFARVCFNFGTNTNIVVPDLAVEKQIGSGVRYVYTLETNGTVKYRQVELGNRIGDRYEILSGLSSGMRVVVKGQSRLSDGKKVRVQQELEIRN